MVDYMSGEVCDATESQLSIPKPTENVKSSS